MKTLKSKTNEPNKFKYQFTDKLNLKNCFKHHINMEYQKITNLLGSTSDKVPKFTTKKWIEVHDQSGEAYNTNKQIRFKTPMLRSDLCDYNDAYIVVRGIITFSAGEKDRDERN